MCWESMWHVEGLPYNDLGPEVPSPLDYSTAFFLTVQAVGLAILFLIDMDFSSVWASI